MMWKCCPVFRPSKEKPSQIEVSQLMATRDLMSKPLGCMVCVSVKLFDLNGFKSVYEFPISMPDSYKYHEVIKK